MKVLIYSEYFLPIPGGVQTIVLELARGLAAWKGKTPEDEPIDVTVVTGTKERTPEDGSLPFRLVRAPTYRELFHLIRKADVLHLAGPAILPLALSFLAKTPAIVEHHGYQSICPNGVLLYEPNRSVCSGHFMEKRYHMCVRCGCNSLGVIKSIRDLALTFPRRWMCRRAAGNIAVSNHVLRRIDLPRTKVIYHGIADCSSVEADGTAGNGNPIQIGYVGRLVLEKGLPLLLEAAKRLDDDGCEFQLTVVGDGTEREEIEGLARKLGFRREVAFLGELHGAALANAVKRLEIVVMPSVWEETAGLVAIEQMMRGGVVIAADIGGLGEIVGDAGLKFPAGDSEALHARLVEAIENRSLRESLGRAARRRAVQAFGRDSMIEGHVELYREALSR